MSGQRRKFSIPWVGIIVYILGIITSIAVSLVTPLVSSILEAQFNGYSYHVLIPGCSQEWKLSEALDSQQASCKGSLLLLRPSSTQNISRAIYFGNGKTFANDYQIRVTIDQMSTGVCAGVFMRENREIGTGYAFYVCQNGSAVIYRYDKNAVPLQIAGGLAKNQSNNSATITAVTQGDILKLFVNGKLVCSNEDNAYAATDIVSLIVSPSGAPVGSDVAAFSDFRMDRIR